MSKYTLVGVLTGIAIAGGAFAGYYWHLTQSPASQGTAPLAASDRIGNGGNVEFVQAENTATDGGVAERYRDWTVLCQPPSQNAQRCMVAQEVRVQDTGERIVLLSVERIQQSNQLRAVIILTINGRLQNQIGLTIEGTQVAAQRFAACDQGSCRAILPLPNETIDMMKRGTSGTVDITTEEGQQIRLPISLSGFTASWTRLGQISG